MKKWVVLLLCCPSILFAEETKNVILIIADGAGYGSFRASAMYNGRDPAFPIPDSPHWKTGSLATYSLSSATKPSGENIQDSRMIYDPKKTWTHEKEIKHFFTTYKNLKKYKTDSAAAATALASGQKTYNAAINWSDADSPLLTAAQIAKNAGKKVGIVTTVQMSHATPAGLGGVHAKNRNLYREIGDKMLNTKTLDVLIGGGHPNYDANGTLINPKKRNYDYVGGEQNWDQLVKKNHPGKWTLIQDRAEFQKMVTTDSTPERLLGIFKSASTTQYDRQKGTPRRTDVPTLSEMTFTAMRVLGKNNNVGFWLGVEAGAPDWANHANQFERMIEEMTELYELIDQLNERLNSGTDGISWDNTLVILTADHETGLILGQESDKIPFHPIECQGKGKYPLHRYHSTDHSNMLVPVYFRGKNATQFERIFKMQDPKVGRYGDNTDVPKLSLDCCGLQFPENSPK